MDLILCHTTADFDTLGAAVGIARLRPGARIVLTGGCHPTVRNFLALHRDEYPLIERRSVNPEQIRSLIVVDTQWRDRLGKAADWFDLPQREVIVYDHHLNSTGDISATQRYIEDIGAATTLVVEQLRQGLPSIELTTAEATVMALGIHVDTGSLTYDHATVRDAAALTWLMEQGASVRAIAEYVEPGLSAAMQDLLAIALDQLETEEIQGFMIARVLLAVDRYIPGLSNLTAHVMSLSEADVLLLGARYPVHEAAESEERLTVVGRCRASAGATSTTGIDLAALFQPLGGGGHARAAALTLRGCDPAAVMAQLLVGLRSQLPCPPVARELMSAPVRTIRPETTIEAAQRILLRYGGAGLCVVDEADSLIGIISRRDLDLALHHGFSHAPVKGYMTTNLKTIVPETSLPDIEALMVTYDIGRLPVLDRDQLVGIVTRTDVLRQLHHDQAKFTVQNAAKQQAMDLEFGLSLLRDRLVPPLLQLLTFAAGQAEERGWHLYLVGGAVRDLLLAKPGDALAIKDIDLVVDGFHQAADQGAGVELAKALRSRYPQVRLQIHGKFQTAALLWHHDPELDSLWVDIATARTEFYPYPAANPVVEASSIRQDLYRRDFTINALALRLTAPRKGATLDFFGGLLDLEAKQVRVLHANSFIEDPTRIYRAVRFAVRLGFEIEPQTEGFIRHAIASGIYQRLQAEQEKLPALQTRLKQELKQILQAPYWRQAMQVLANLGAIECIHADLHWTPALWWQLRLVDRWLRQFDRQERLAHWQVLLETLLMQLPEVDRVKVARNFQLAADSIARLEQVDRARAMIVEQLPDCQRPSQFVQLLSQFDLEMLILVAVDCPRSVRCRIWQYLTQWAAVRSPLSGTALKAMGYRAGKEFKQILAVLLRATLDGEIGDRSSAEAYVREHFPL